jgi:hypothetical protein
MYFPTPSLSQFGHLDCLSASSQSKDTISCKDLHTNLESLASSLQLENDNEGEK